MPDSFDFIIAELKSMANPRNVEGMARFGINAENTLGISVVAVRKLAKPYRRDHELALRLWETGIHEARILATVIDDPAQVTPDQMESWAAAFNSWDVVDQACGNLFAKTPQAYDKVRAWSKRDEEFVKRAAFSLIATLAVHDKKASTTDLEAFYPLIRAAAIDERNFVKKAVNWALRQIGKRNRALNASALKLAHDLAESDSKSARWVGKDAIRELESEKTRARLKN